MVEWCNKAHYDVSGLEVISACLTQGKYDIHHSHGKPSSHLGSGNLDPNVTPHPKQWQEHRTTTPCRWDQLLSRVIHLQCRLLTQSRPLLSGYLGPWGSVLSVLGTPQSSPLRFPHLFFLPSFPIRKLTHTHTNIIFSPFDVYFPHSHQFTMLVWESVFSWLAISKIADLLRHNLNSLTFSIQLLASQLVLLQGLSFWGGWDYLLFWLCLIFRLCLIFWYSFKLWFSFLLAEEQKKTVCFYCFLHLLRLSGIWSDFLSQGSF